MFYTIVNLGTVAVILIYWFFQSIKLAYLTPYITLKNNKEKKGITKEAVIVSVSNLSKKTENPLLRIVFEFGNFSKQPIRETLSLTDTKYHLKRYETGQRIKIKMNPDLKPNRPVQLVGANYSVNKIVLSIKTAIIITYLLGTGYLVKFILDFMREYPEHYQEAFANSGLFFLAIIFLIIYIFILRLVRGFGFLGTKKRKSQDWDIKYYGIKATAQIMEYRDTGIMINEDPKVKFLYTFNDSNGEVVEGDDDIIIGKLEIGKLQEMKEMDIMYLADNPDVSRLVSNLNSNESEGCIQYIFLFIAVVFSFCLILSLIEPMRHVREFY